MDDGLWVMVKYENFAILELRWFMWYFPDNVRVVNKSVHCSLGYTYFLEQGLRESRRKNECTKWHQNTAVVLSI